MPVRTGHIYIKAALLSATAALLLLSGGCAVHKKKGAHPPKADYSHYFKPRHNSTHSQRSILREASEWMDTPYVYAGTEKGKGADCSGMVMKVYEEAVGCLIPRNSAKQAEFCIPLKSSEVEPGDLVFFATGKDPKRISHVGIMLDEENFIHASTSKGVVISKVNTPYYIRTFMMYGRVPLD